MGSSIQDYLKKINSRLSLFDIASLIVTAFLLAAGVLYFTVLWKGTQKPVLYRSKSAFSGVTENESRPFGSKSGTTYTYSWCQGGERIKPENKVYYNNGEEAELSGRTLSKLCQK